MIDDIRDDDLQNKLLELQRSDSRGDLQQVGRDTRTHRKSERIGQCGYHLHYPVAVRLVQLTADPPNKKPREWQSPMWICKPCRDYLDWHFRYVEVDR